MGVVRFRAKVQIRGVNPYVLVTRDRAAAIKEGRQKPLPVVVRINDRPGNPWLTNMMPVGNGDFYLYLHGGMRKDSDTKVGDTISMEVAFDADYLGGMPPMPDWFADALSSQPTAKANWRKLPPSRRKEVLRYFANLKSPEAKAINLERAMNALSGGHGRFMGRTWSDGS